MKWSANDNSYMQLRGQGATAGRGAACHGYAMAALLVGMSVMAVLMGAALPVWNKQAQREREEEYLFRATEYARAIQKFQRRAGPGTLPPNFDVLVEGRFLRRKYKDPITGSDFQPVFQTVTAPGQPAGNATPGGAVAATPTARSGGTATGQRAPVPGAGVIGVVSKSKASSIKVYNGRTRYDEWAVTYQDVKPGKGLPPDLLQALNATRAGAAGQPGVGQPGGQPGANPFGQPGSSIFGQPGGAPFGQPPGGAPFGTPGAPPGASPFGGAPGTSPFGGPPTAPSGGSGGFTPAYPPPPGSTGAPIFGGPPRKTP
jgi:type II secretory pathway pseudopilin PulG